MTIYLYLVCIFIIEAFQIAGNAVIIFKGNLVALLCCTEHAPFWPYFIALKNYNWLVNFYYQCYNILSSAKGEEVPISFFPLSMTEWDRMTFLSLLDQGKTYMNSRNMIDIWEKLQLTISPLCGYIVHGEGRVQYYYPICPS